MSLKGLFLAASRYFLAQQGGLAKDQEKFPEFAQSFLETLQQQGPLRTSFIGLADAEPLRRREILSSWLRERKIVPKEHVRPLCVFLARDDGFESFIEALARSPLGTVSQGGGPDLNHKIAS